MAEIKNAFIQSKMNKDLDDRLLPSGQYRDAINIAVSKSESSDVGALENVLGNTSIFNLTSILPESYADCQAIGYLVSENINTIFVFLTNNINDQYPYASDNAIVSYNSATKVSKVHVSGSFLNFSTTHPIYGINLLENLLFWTDNRNQPRKINIIQDYGYYTSENNISVAKYYPYECISLFQESEIPNEYETTMYDVVSEYLPDGTTANPYYDPLYEGDPNYLEDKFIRFSYRFKYDDGEYSLFAPFTQDCFIPKQDGYFLENDENQTYRSTVVYFMENKVNKILLNVPLPSNDIYNDYKITEIDILYKESDGLAVQVVDTIQVNPNEFITNNYVYAYKCTKPYKTLPEKDLIRVYDKIPVKAFSQEIISNRIVYGNFLDKHTAPDYISYNVGAGDKSAFNIDSESLLPPQYATSIVEYPNSSLKQNRNYQAGIVLSDKFGRQSSVVLSNSSLFDNAAFKASTIFTNYRNTFDTNALDWPGESLKILFNEAIGPEEPDSSINWPGLYSATNPTGWYSYKIVVKQTEQDYYNVYLPGVLASYPGTSTNYGGSTYETGFTSHVPLISDNINKIPRDLSEVGPDQKQYRSSIKLFGRVENIDGTGVITNEQYYPPKKSFNVSNISLENDFFPSLSSDATNNYVFYQAISNPSIARISTSESFGVYTAATPPTVINLAIFETAPTISRLDIYWETSTSGLISELNNAILSSDNTLIKDFAGWNFTLHEENALNTNINNNSYFYPVDFGDTGITSTNLLIESVKTKDGVDVTSKFQLIKVPAGAVLPGGGTESFDCYYLENLSYFYYGYTSNITDGFIFRFTNNGNAINIIKNGALINNSPYITNKPAGDEVNKLFEDEYAYIFEGSNGANINGIADDSTKFNQKDMEWYLSGDGVDNGTFVLETYFENGIYKAKIINNNLTAFGLYNLTIKLEDAGGLSDIYAFKVIFGEQPAVGGFASHNSFSVIGDEALNIYFTNESTDFNTGQAIGALPENNLFPTSSIETAESSNCAGGDIGTSYNKVSRNFTPALASRSLENGTGYLLINFTQEVPVYDSNFAGERWDYNSVKIQIDYRDIEGPGYPNNWEAAEDIEGVTLDNIGGTWTSADSPYINNGFLDNAGFATNELYADIKSLNSSNDTPRNCNAQRAFAFNKPGDYRVYTNNLKGVTTLCYNSFTNPEWNNNELTYLTIESGDFYYDSYITGGFRAYAYIVSSLPKTTEGEAFSQTPDSQIVWAKEPLLRYVSQFYNSTEMKDSQKVSLNGAGWYSYSSVQSAYQSHPGQGAEGAYTGSVNNIDEYNRRWVAEFDANGAKILGTSRPVWK